jgi:hypothetical protein
VKRGIATYDARTQEVLQIVLDGAEPHDVWQFVSEREKEPDNPWTLKEGEKPLSVRQIRRYMRKSEDLIAEDCRTSRRKLIRRHVVRRRNIVAKAIASGDLRTALAALDSEARILRLDQPSPATTPKGDLPNSPAAVVALLAARLASIDQARLPPGEHTRLTTTLADSLLRAIGVGVLDGRLEALQAVLLGRKGPDT